MANIKSQIKRNRQNEKRRLRNRDFRGAARTAVKAAHASLEAGQESSASVMAAISALDKAAQKGAVHPRNASRRKGRLMKRLAHLGPMAAGSAARPAAPAAEMEQPKPKAAKKTAAKSAAKKTAEKKPAAKKAAAKK